MTDARTFPTTTILTAYTGRMLTRDIGDLYDILGYLTGDTGIMTHQLGDAADAVKPDMARQLPWLPDAPTLPAIPDDVTGHARERIILDYIDTVNTQYGPEHELTPAPEAWGEHDPLADLDKMLEKNNSNAKVIPVITN